MNKSPNNEASLEILAARFAYASAAVLTLSDMLATISAGLALRLLEEGAATTLNSNSNVNSNANSNRNSNRNSSSSSNSQNNSMFSFEVEQMHRQMDELIREMKRLKKMMNA